MKYIFTIATCTFFSLFGKTQFFVTLPVAYDSPIVYHDYYNHTDLNYGNKPYLAAFEIPGVQGGVNTNRALLYFDLSQIPGGSTIMSAKLDLYAYTEFTVAPVNDGHYGNNAAKLNRITSQWSENQVTWNTQPTTSTLHEKLLNQSIAPDQDYLDIDVKDLVQDMTDNPNNSFGFELSLINEVVTTNLSFCSGEYPNTAKRPTLEIEYRLATGIDEIALATYSIYPNPSLDHFSISFEQNDARKIHILDQQGKIVRSIESNDATTVVQTDLLAAGIYNIVIESATFQYPVKKWMKVAP
jgi:hypothetical protein